MNLQEMHSIRSTPVAPEEIVELREELGRYWRPLAQDKLANALGVSQATLSRWETGDGIPAGPAAKLFRLLRSSTMLARDG